MIADDNLLTAIAVVQAREAEDTAAYADLLTNTSAADLITGLIDVVRLVTRVTSPDTGRTTNELLADLFALHNRDELTPERFSAAPTPS